MTGLDKTALKPCPFCGGGAYMNYSDRGELFGVRCNHWHGNGGSIKCMGAGPYADTEEEAIAGWNRRAALPVTEEQVEAAGSVDDVAARLWRAEAEDAGTPASVSNGRTREAFDDQSENLKNRWRKFARAALSSSEVPNA